MLAEMNLDLREATTRYVNITCKSRETGENFDLTDYVVQTYLSFGQNQQYVNTAKIGSMVSYKIPAEISQGARKGVAETRIFKDGDVFEVLRINIDVYKAEKPDIVPGE